MELKTLHINYQDERGIIMDVVTHLDFQHVTFITSKIKSFRGDHYHKSTGQYIFLLSGQLKYVSRNRQTRKVEVVIMNSNDLAFSPPDEEHGFLAIKDSTILVLTCGPRGGEDYEKDTFRLSSDESLMKFIS